LRNRVTNHARASAITASSAPGGADITARAGHDLQPLLAAQSGEGRAIEGITEDASRRSDRERQP